MEAMLDFVFYEVLPSSLIEMAVAMNEVQSGSHRQLQHSFLTVLLILIKVPRKTRKCMDFKCPSQTISEWILYCSM